jgi:predicted branched-subunit amino acid permease
VLLFLFAVIVIYFSKKKKEIEFLLAAVCSLAAAVLFKTEFLVELGIVLWFPEGKRRSEQD